MFRYLATMPTLKWLFRDNLVTITAAAAGAIGAGSFLVYFGVVDESFSRDQWREHLYYQCDFNYRETGRIVKQHLNDIENISLPHALNNSLPRPLVLNQTKDLNLPDITREQRLIAYNSGFLHQFFDMGLDYTTEFMQRKTDVLEKLAFDTQLNAFEEFLNRVIEAKRPSDNANAVALLKKSAGVIDENAKNAFKSTFGKSEPEDTPVIYDSPLKWIPYYGVYSAFLKTDK